MNQGVPELLETFDKAQVASALGLGGGRARAPLPRLNSAAPEIRFLLVPVRSLEAH